MKTYETVSTLEVLHPLSRSDGRYLCNRHGEPVRPQRQQASKAVFVALRTAL